MINIVSEHSTEAVLQVRDLTFRYGSTPVLSELSLDLYRDDVLLLTGASGAGKSTLLRVLARLLEPESGTVLLNGQPREDIDPTRYRRRVAYLQQQPVMVSGSVRENLLLSFRFGSAEPPSRELLGEMLDRTALSGVSLEQSAAELSVGQQQRIALLRLLLMEPEVLLLDEPTASLDDEAARLLMESVAAAREQADRAVLLVSHNDGGASDVLSPRRAVLRSGHVEEAS